MKGKSVAFGPISEALDVEGVQDFHEAAAFAVTFMGNPNKAEFKGMMNDALNILQNKAPKGLLTSYHLNHKLFLMALLNSDFQSAHFRVLKDGFLKRKVIDKPSFDAFLEEISGEQIRALAQAVYETSYTVLQAQQNRVSPADQVSPFSPN